MLDIIPILPAKHIQKSPKQNTTTTTVIISKNKVRVYK